MLNSQASSVMDWSEAPRKYPMFREPRLVSRPVVRIGAKVHFGADGKTLEKLLT